jgi:hypothetical protein
MCANANALCMCGKWKIILCHLPPTPLNHSTSYLPTIHHIYTIKKIHKIHTYTINHTTMVDKYHTYIMVVCTYIRYFTLILNMSVVRENNQTPVSALQFWIRWAVFARENHSTNHQHYRRAVFNLAEIGLKHGHLSPLCSIGINPNGAGC